MHAVHCMYEAHCMNAVHCMPAVHCMLKSALQASALHLPLAWASALQANMPWSMPCMFTCNICNVHARIPVSLHACMLACRLKGFTKATLQFQRSAAYIAFICPFQHDSVSARNLNLSVCFKYLRNCLTALTYAVQTGWFVRRRALTYAVDAYSSKYVSGAFGRRRALRAEHARY